MLFSFYESMKAVLSEPREALLTARDQMHSGPQSGFIFCHLLEMFMTDLYCNLLSLKNKITCVHVMTAIGRVTSQSNELPHSWTPINRPENISLPFSSTQIFPGLDSFIGPNLKW